MTTSDTPTSRMTWLEILRRTLAEVFGADLRSLALFRMTMAVVLLGDLLITRLPNLTAFYTDVGVLPRAVMIQEIPMTWSTTIHLMSGERVIQAGLLLLEVLAALAMLVGYHTRVATILSWALLISLDMRNILPLSGADVLLRLLLFWSMFLPLGAWWSVDSARGRTPQRLSPRFVSVGVAGLFLQIAFVYIFTALLKTGGDWRGSGMALYYALSLDQFRTVLGDVLYDYYGLMQVLTICVFWMEAIAPILLLSPVFNAQNRILGVITIMGLHVGIGATMAIGLFPWVGSLCMVCFLPTWFWDKVMPVLDPRLADLRRLARALSLPWRGTRLPVPGAPLLRTATEPAGIAALEPDATGDARSLAAQPVHASVASAAASDSPASFGRGRHRVTDPPRVQLRSSIWTNLLAGFFIVVIYWINMTTVTSFRMPRPVEALSHFLQLNQKWGMFSPTVGRESHWFVLPGRLQNGTELDLNGVLRGDLATVTPVSWSRPASVSGTFRDHRWEKLLTQLVKPANADMRPPLSRYVCNQWNSRHSGDERLVQVDFYYVWELTQPNYQRSKIKSYRLSQHTCE